MTRYVCYYRVSTQRQGQSGLGLEAQRASVLGFIGDGELIAEYTDIESGRRTDRPELAKALDHCRRTKSTLIIARLDRLARNVAFVAALMESDVEFVAVDMPTANRLTVHILAAVAEETARAISINTKAALAAAKARGVRLGNPNTTRALTAAHDVLKGNADDHARTVTPIIVEVRRAGITSLAGIAKALDARGIKTARGGRWTAQAVKNAMARTA